MSILEEHSWRKAVLDVDSKIYEAVESLNNSSIQIVIVIDKTDRLVGTLTDGDIRRALLDGKGLSDSIDQIVNRKPIFIDAPTARQEILQMMLQNKVQQIPQIEENGKLVNVHLWSEVNTQKIMTNKFVVMAGGRGSRLLPLTKNLPKPMLDVGGKPMLEHIILNARFQGFRRFVISVGYKSDLIKEHFKSGEKFEVEIEYIDETKPLGTAGALSMLSNNTGEDVVVTNGDVLTDINYVNLLHHNKAFSAVGTMGVRIIEEQNQFGVVRTDGVELVGFEEKPVTKCTINAGIYVLSNSLLKLIPKNEKFDMPQLFQAAKINRKKVIVFPLHESWIDVGRKDDYQLAIQNYSKKEK